jgi:polyvinyl alcohol dehydrogenase (cytochrome)
MISRRALTVSVLAVAMAADVLVPTGFAHAGDGVRGSGREGGWPSGGQNIHNTRVAAAERVIGPGSVSDLTTRWSVTTAGDVFATPAVAGGIVYFPDFGGVLWAVRADTGTVRWSHSVGDYTGFPADGSRTSPAVSGNLIIIGDWTVAGTTPVGANIIAVDRTSGAKVWQTQVDNHPTAKITSSPVIFDGVVYVGVSSNEEGITGQPGYVCCTFRGSVVALDLRTGRLLWKTYTVPVGYSGGAVWGGTPAVNARGHLVYVGTGNNYAVPPGVCTAPMQTGCELPAADNHADAVLALDLGTGAVRWAKHTLTADVGTIVCGPHPTGTCGPDFDFGSAPNLITLPSGRQLLGVGQKSGVYWALDPDSGADVWHTRVGPGSIWGGIEWGTAADGRTIFAAIANGDGLPYTITSASGQSSTITGGSWAALDAQSGQLLWQTADPQGAMDLGFVSAANGVVYAPSSAATGNNMYALDAVTGQILWRFASGGSVISGAAIVDGTVYWGSGYYFATACPGAPSTVQFCRGGPAAPAPGRNNRLYAFGLRDQEPR